jgi:ketosteroid isomerase-like protein
MIRILAICACILAAAAWFRFGVVGTSCSRDQTGIGNQVTVENSRTTLEKLYDQMNQALANQDIDKYLSFLQSDSYVFVDSKGKQIPFAEYSASARKNEAKKRNENATTSIKDVQVVNGRMVAYVEDDDQLEIDVEKDGWIPFIITQTSEDTWEAKNGEWTLVLTKTLRRQQAIDPQWLAAQQKIKQMQLDGARALIYPCNFSSNGCR